MMKRWNTIARYPAPARKVSGFSLIEFLVASILSMIVLIAVSSGYFVSRQLSDTALARLNVQQDLRNASNMIVRDARMAGSFGCFNMATHEAATVTEDADSEAAIRLRGNNQTNLIPVKVLSAADFQPADFAANSDALIFQYGVGSASIVSQTGNSSELQIPTGDPLQNAGNTTPLVFSSCNVLDRPQRYTVARSDNRLTISDINPALNTGHIANEFAVLRYTVNAYVIGTAGEQQGLFRFQLNDNGQWSNPQLLMPGITNMDMEYGYVNNCAVSGAASDATAAETFEFVDALKAGNDAVSPALIRITLNGGNDVAAATGTGVSAGDVHVYNIDATVRGGNTCADRTI